MSHEHLGLFDTPPDRRQIRLSFAIVGLLFVTLLLILPVRYVRLPEVDAFMPMIDTAMFVAGLITATLLYAQAAVFRSRALTALGTGYVYTALLLIPHALTFPGAFSPSGLLGAGVNTTVWIAFLRRLAFPIAAIAYVQFRRGDLTAQAGPERPAAGIAVGVFAALAPAAAVTLLSTVGYGLLPPLFVRLAGMTFNLAISFEPVVFVLFIVATTMLLRQRKSVLDMWLLVALSAWLMQSLMIITLRGRFTAGWYWLYVVAVFAHLVVMLALLAESNRLYARLALSTAARSRERETRLMSIDAMAAAISHEVGQPLAAVGANATASLNWLTRPKPDVAMAIKSLRDALDASQRATDVIRSIRAMFAKQPGRASEFSLNDLVRETAALLDRELASAKVSLQVALDEALPPIRADRIQIQRVLVNLFTNAIESLGATRGRPRRIAIRSASLDGHDVLLEVSDNGIGFAPEEMANLFEPFFTTKASGAGLGLSLCRDIVGVHGGHLWATRGEKHGATFHVQLPAHRPARAVTASNAADDAGPATSAGVRTSRS